MKTIANAFKSILLVTALLALSPCAHAQPESPLTSPTPQPLVPPAQSPLAPAVKPHVGPFIPGRVLLALKAATKEDAMRIARTLPNFRVDESYGAIPLGDSNASEFLVRGDKLGPIVDPNNEIVQEASDSLLSPN